MLLCSGSAAGMQAVWSNPYARYPVDCVCEPSGKLSTCVCHSVASVFFFWSVPILLLMPDLVCRHATCQCKSIARSAELGRAAPAA